MKTLLTAMLSTLLSHGTTTTPLIQSGPVPEKCPSIMSISSQGLDYVAPAFIFWNGVKENSSYDTKENWTFVMVDDSDESNGRVAIKQLVKNINVMRLKGGPEWDDKMGRYGCEYADENHKAIFAVAITPSLYS